MLEKVFGDIKKALAGYGVHSGYNGDRYVTGGVNWDGYDLQTLVGMVSAPADPGQVDTVAGLWRTHGAAITQSAENLSQSLTTLLNYWQGSAADQASAAVTNTANWITAVGETAGKLADSVEDAGGALRSAQSTMPGVGATATVPVPLLAGGFNPAADGATVASAGGPFGAASGALMGGLTSMFDAGAVNTALKQQAVQTMQRYEQAATTIDTNTPRFAAPVVWTAGGGADGGTGTGIAGGGGVGGGQFSTSGGTTTVTSGASGVGTVGQGTVPSFADSPAGRWNALTATGGARLGGIGGVGGGGAGSFAAMGLFGGTGFGDPQAADKQKSASSGNSAAASEPSGTAVRADSARILEDVNGPGAAGAPGAPGMAAPMRGGGGQEGEYRRRIPFEEEPFTTGLKAVPPVIGLNAVD